MESRLAQINTKRGSFFYNLDDFVYVYLGKSKITNEDITIRKKVSDLNEDDRILLESNTLDLPLEEIKNDLYEHDLEYKVSRDKVLKINDSGEEIPMLRILLLEGLLKKLSIDYDENKVLKNGDDYSKQEYSLMLNVLETVLPNENRNTMSTWFNKGTYLPRKKEVLKQLGELNSKFLEIYNDVDGFLFDYNDYVNTNRIIRRQIGGLSDDNSKTFDSNFSGSVSHGRFAKRLEFLASKYGQLITNKVIAVPVKKVNVINSTSTNSNNSNVKTKSALSCGIVKKWDVNEDIYSIRESIAQDFILTSCLNDGLFRYFYNTDFIKKNNSSNSRFTQVQLLKLKVIDQLIGDRAGKYQKPIYDAHLKKLNVIDEWWNPFKLFDDQVKLFFNNYNVGKLDGMTRVEDGTWEQLVSVMKKVHSALPSSLYSMRAYSESISTLNYHINNTNSVKKKNRYKKAISRLNNEFSLIRDEYRENYDVSFDYKTTFSSYCYSLAKKNMKLVDINGNFNAERLYKGVMHDNRLMIASRKYIYDVLRKTDSLKVGALLHPINFTLNQRP